MIAPAVAGLLVGVLLMLHGGAILTVLWLNQVRDRLLATSPQKRAYWLYERGLLSYDDYLTAHRENGVSVTWRLDPSRINRAALSAAFGRTEDELDRILSSRSGAARGGSGKGGRAEA